MHVEPAFDGLQENQSSPEAGHQTMEPINEDIASSSPIRKSVDLSLQIPPRPVAFGKNSTGKGILQSPCSSKRSSTSGDLESLNFKNKPAVHDGLGSSLLTQDTKEVPQSPVLASILSVFSWKRCSSLPVRHTEIMSPSVSTPTQQMTTEQSSQSVQKPTGPSRISRSLSVPVRNVVIIRSVSSDAHKEHVQAEPSEDQVYPKEVGDEEIPEEEAVCRICLVSLCEGGKTFKLECCCKGDLTLTHEECAVKWFKIKGNRKCDVCGQEVTNLPVNLLRVRSSAQRPRRHERNWQNLVPNTISACHDFVVLILISSISYFFILEQLLVNDLSTKAVAIAVPFAFILGLSGSMLAMIVATKEYLWTYAALEFALASMMVHLFYVVVHLPAACAITFAAILGFGIALCINLLYLYLCSYRSSVTQRQSNADRV